MIKLATFTLKLESTNSLALKVCHDLGILELEISGRLHHSTKSPIKSVITHSLHRPSAYELPSMGTNETHGLFWRKVVSPQHQTIGNLMTVKQTGSIVEMRFDEVCKFAYYCEGR